MLAYERPEVLVDVPVVRGQVPLVDEAGLALGALPVPLGKVARDVAVQVLLRLKRGAASQALELLNRKMHYGTLTARICKRIFNTFGPSL